MHDNVVCKIKKNKEKKRIIGIDWPLDQHSRLKFIITQANVDTIYVVSGFSLFVSLLIPYLTIVL